jgi:hypothetical protein
MASGPDPANRSRAAVIPRWGRILLVVAAAIVLGGLTALRFIDRSGSGGGSPEQRLPTAGLVYFGVLFTVGGLLFLVPRYWRWQAGQSRWSGRTVFGTMPAREELPAWRRVLWDIQEMLIERDRRRREAMQRDPRPYQLRASVTAITTGITLLVYAALR